MKYNLFSYSTKTPFRNFESYVILEAYICGFVPLLMLEVISSIEMTLTSDKESNFAGSSIGM
jgi:hypothetical protein